MLFELLCVVQPQTLQNITLFDKDIRIIRMGDLIKKTIAPDVLLNLYKEYSIIKQYSLCDTHNIIITDTIL